MLLAIPIALVIGAHLVRSDGRATWARPVSCRGRLARAEPVGELPYLGGRRAQPAEPRLHHRPRRRGPRRVAAPLGPHRLARRKRFWVRRCGPMDGDPPRGPCRVRGGRRPFSNRGGWRRWHCSQSQRSPRSPAWSSPLPARRSRRTSARPWPGPKRGVAARIHLCRHWLSGRIAVLSSGSRPSADARTSRRGRALSGGPPGSRRDEAVRMGGVRGGLMPAGRRLLRPETRVLPRPRGRHA